MDYSVTLKALANNTNQHVFNAINSGLRDINQLSKAFPDLTISTFKATLNSLRQEHLVYQVGNNYYLTKEATILDTIAKRKFATPELERDYYEDKASEEEFIFWYKGRDQDRYEKPSATIDLIGLRYFNQHLQILLLKRKHHPYQHAWALPGGFIEARESINDACLREVKEETNIDLDDSQLLRLPAVSKPGRDPRMWVITNPNIVLFTPDDLKHYQIKAGDDAGDAKWFDLSLDTKNHLQIDAKLAFDHYDIIQNALRYLKDDFDHRRLPLIAKLLGHYATTREMIKLFSTIDSKQFSKLQPTNIKIRYQNYLIPTTKRRADNAKGRRSIVYKF